MKNSSNARRPYEMPDALFIAVGSEDILTASVGDDEMQDHYGDAGVNTPLIDESGTWR